MLMKSLIAAGLLLAPAATQTRDWRMVTVAKPISSVMFVDAGDIHPDAKPYPTIRLLVVMGTNKEYPAIEVLMEFDCVRHRRHGLEARAYNAEGKNFENAGVEAKWNDMPPGSFYGDAEAIACGRRIGLPARSYGSGLPIAEGQALLAGN